MAGQDCQMIFRINVEHDPVFNIETEMNYFGLIWIFVKKEHKKSSYW